MIRANRAGIPANEQVFQIGFADYASPGGAMKMKRVVGEQELRNLLASMGIQPNPIENALRGLRDEGNAYILSVVIPDEMLRRFGLLDESTVKSGKEKVEAAINMLRRQGHRVEPVVRESGKMQFYIDSNLLISWLQMQNLFDGVYSLAGLEEELRRQQSEAEKHKSR